MNPSRDLHRAKEMVELYVAKGSPDEDARTVVGVFARDKETWLEVMMVEELGIVRTDQSPVRNGIVTFLSFALFGLIPLFAYVLARMTHVPRIEPFPVACLLTAATLFALGAMKARITGRDWVKSGLETLVGGGAASAAFVVGRLLGGYA